MDKLVMKTTPSQWPSTPKVKHRGKRQLCLLGFSGAVKGGNRPWNRWMSSQRSVGGGESKQKGPEGLVLDRRNFPCFQMKLDREVQLWRMRQPQVDRGISAFPNPISNLYLQRSFQAVMSSFWPQSREVQGDHKRFLQGTKNKPLPHSGLLPNHHPEAMLHCGKWGRAGKGKFNSGQTMHSYLWLKIITY